MNSTTKRGKRFPLWRHKGTGLWCKKHKGGFYYFGTDKDEALARYLAEWQDILAGRKPRPRSVELSVGGLSNQFLTLKRQQVTSGELSPRSWSDYHAACEDTSYCLEGAGPESVANR